MRDVINVYNRITNLKVHSRVTKIKGEKLEGLDFAELTQVVESKNHSVLHHMLQDIPNHYEKENPPKSKLKRHTTKNSASVGTRKEVSDGPEPSCVANKLTKAHCLY